MMDPENLQGDDVFAQESELSDARIYKEHVTPAMVALRYLLYTHRVVVTDVEKPTWVVIEWVPKGSIRNTLWSMLNRVLADYYDSPNRVAEIVYRTRGASFAVTELLVVPMGIEHLAQKPTRSTVVERAVTKLIEFIIKNNATLDQINYGRRLGPEIAEEINHTDL